MGRTLEDNAMLALLLVQLSSTASVISSRCDAVAPTQIDRKADLPAEVLAHLPAPMAEHGEEYQAGDVIASPPLPFFRFVVAEQNGCDLWITYEHGGRGHGKLIAKFEHATAGWRQIKSPNK